MIMLPSAVRIFLCTRPTDMRKGFDGLTGLVQECFGQDPLSGHLFLFVNRRRDRIKILYFDRDGLAIWYKKQEGQCPHSISFTEFSELVHNLTGRLTRVVAVDANSPIPDSRSRPMSHAAIAVVPPRTHQPHWFSINSGIG